MRLVAERSSIYGILTLFFRALRQHARSVPHNGPQVFPSGLSLISMILCVNGGSCVQQDAIFQTFFG
jgi:hypothetical protein